MRRQPGTDQLRLLLYFDEVLGFVPPVANPPAKPPLLRIFKQGRAFGVGAVLATQNPVDLDYKALANAGTWAIGRLQTEQDKKRLLDGMAAAAGGVDIAAVSDTIAALGKREFVLRRAAKDQPLPFTTRWAMSYLRGPLTRDQLSALPKPDHGDADAGRAGADTAGNRTGIGGADTGGSSAPPTDGVPARWLAPSAPWAASIGSVPTSTSFVAAVALRGSLTYDDRILEGGSHREDFEAVVLPLGAGFDPASLHVVDHDDRDFLLDGPAAATYVVPDDATTSKTAIEALRRAVVDHLLASRTLTVSVNRELKLASRPGEAPEAFAARCLAAAENEADREATELRRRYQTRIRREADQVSTAADRVARAESAVNTQRSNELVDGAGSVLGALFGGRRRAGSIVNSMSHAANRRRRSEAAQDRLEGTRQALSEQQHDVVALETELAGELAELVARWQAAGAAVEQRQVPLEKSDIAVTALCLLWVPVG